MIVICGRNHKLERAMNAMPRRLPSHIVGFTTEIPYFMSLSDFFIGKPGPGSITEAVAMKLPVIVQRNAWTLPHERYNTDWVREKNVGIVVRDFSSIRQAVTDLLRTGPVPRVSICRCGDRQPSRVRDSRHPGRYCYEAPSRLSTYDDAKPRIFQPQIVLAAILSLPPGPAQCVSRLNQPSYPSARRAAI